MRNLILSAVVFFLQTAVAFAGDCRKFVGEYESARLSLAIRADRGPDFVEFVYSDSLSSTVLIYRADGVDHHGDGKTTGDTYNAVCGDQRIIIRESFNGVPFVRELLPTPTGIIQFGSIAGQKEETRAMKRIK